MTPLSAPSIPVGYTSFPNAMSLLYLHQKDWMLRDLSLTITLAPFSVPDQDPVAMFAALYRWEKNRSARRQICDHLGSCLASAKTYAVGVSKANGELYWIPAAAWRLTSFSGPNRSAIPVIEAVFDGSQMGVPGKFGGTMLYYPLLSSRELALAFDAETPPAEPEVRPVGESPRTAIERPADVSLMDASPGSATIRQAVSSNLPIVSDGKRELPSPNNLGGRPAVHAWEAFWIEVACWAAKNDLQEDDRPALRRHMLAWFAEQSSAPPDDSAVDRKLRALYVAATRQT